MRHPCLIALAALSLAACDPIDWNDPDRAGGVTGTPSAETSFVGLWGADEVQCATPQELETAPMAISKTGYDQYETHCAFDTIEGQGANVWVVSGTCSVQGDAQTFAMEMSINNDQLTLSSEGQAYSVLQRCP